MRQARGAEKDGATLFRSVTEVISKHPQCHEHRGPHDDNSNIGSCHGAVVGTGPCLSSFFGHRRTAMAALGGLRHYRIARSIPPRGGAANIGQAASALRTALACGQIWALRRVLSHAGTLASCLISCRVRFPLVDSGRSFLAIRVRSRSGRACSAWDRAAEVRCGT